jgi:hypothetical protein
MNIVKISKLYIVFNLNHYHFLLYGYPVCGTLLLQVN